MLIGVPLQTAEGETRVAVTALVGMLNPFDRDGLQRIATAGLTSFALCSACPRVVNRCCVLRPRPTSLPIR